MITALKTWLDAIGPAACSSIREIEILLVLSDFNENAAWYTELISPDLRSALVEFESLVDSRARNSALTVLVDFNRTDDVDMPPVSRFRFFVKQFLNTEEPVVRQVTCEMSMFVLLKPTHLPVHTRALPEGHVGLVADLRVWDLSV